MDNFKFGSITNDHIFRHYDDNDKTVTVYGDNKPILILGPGTKITPVPQPLPPVDMEKWYAGKYDQPKIVSDINQWENYPPQVNFWVTVDRLEPDQKLWLWIKFKINYAVKCVKAAMHHRKTKRYRTRGEKMYIKTGDVRYFYSGWSE